jgi:hypothetical protein
MARQTGKSSSSAGCAAAPARSASGTLIIEALGVIVHRRKRNDQLTASFMINLGADHSQPMTLSGQDWR